MKLVTFEHGTRLCWGLLTGEGKVVDLTGKLRGKSGTPIRSILELLDDEGSTCRPADIDAIAGAQKQAFDLSEVILKPPVLWPRKLLCLAGNYTEHIREGGGEVPGKSSMTPRVFMKPPTSTLIGAYDTISLPANAQWIDWECELGVVIGRRGRFIPAKDASDYIAGYTVVNDVSERRLRVPAERSARPGDEWFDWLNGKWFDTFAPMGPCLVLKDAIPDPHALRITLRVNGEVKQDSRTSMMIFSIPELIEWCSTLVTLEPGDVISTGTPSGVGHARGEFLRAGDVVESEIEGIGILRNPVEDDRRKA